MMNPITYPSTFPHKSLILSAMKSQGGKQVLGSFGVGANFIIGGAFNGGVDIGFNGNRPSTITYQGGFSIGEGFSNPGVQVSLMGGVNSNPEKLITQ